MASYNKVFLMGNLTFDPQVKQLPSQTTVAEFGIAVNRRYRTAAGEEKEEVAFVDCTAFGRVAETISQYFTKGKPIFVEGRLKYDTWEDKQGGGKRSKLTVVVENFKFLGKRGDGDEPGEPASARKPQHRGPMDERPRQSMGGKPQRSESVASPIGGDKYFEESEIPF